MRGFAEQNSVFFEANYVLSAQKSFKEFYTIKGVFCTLTFILHA